MTFKKKCDINMDLLEFIIEAKKNTYASSKITDKLNKDGSKELIFEKDSLKYIDKYYGFNPFSGQEIIFKDYKGIWSMNYYGFIKDHLVSEKEVYSFLKKALLNVEKRFPLRGPNIYREGDFEYFSDTSGFIEEFNGKERIDYNGKTVYHGFYHGGLLRDKLI